MTNEEFVEIARRFWRLRTQDEREYDILDAQREEYHKVHGKYPEIESEDKWPSSVRWTETSERRDQLEKQFWAACQELFQESGNSIDWLAEAESASPKDVTST